MQALLAERIGYDPPTDDALDENQHLERSDDPSTEDPLAIFRAVWDLGPAGQATMALALCALGYADQAVTRSRGAVDLAVERGSVAIVLQTRGFYHAIVLMWRGDLEESIEQGQWVVREAEERGLGPYFATLSSFPLGWCLARTGQVDEGIAMLRRGVQQWTSTGWHVGTTWFTALLADALRMGGRAEEGLRSLNEAIANSRTVDDFWQETEIRRIRGDLLLSLPVPDPVGAEAAYRSAIDLAREQHAKLYELRAATNLARLLHTQERDNEARALLAPLYASFTEGFDTADLREARRLLDEMG